MCRRFHTPSAGGIRARSLDASSPEYAAWPTMRGQCHAARVDTPHRLGERWRDRWSTSTPAPEEPEMSVATVARLQGIRAQGAKELYSGSDTENERVPKRPPSLLDREQSEGFQARHVGEQVVLDIRDHV